MHRSLIFLLLTIALAVVTLDAARRQAPAVVTANADAVRLNNLGVASMNQQKFEAALKYFQDASAKDASFPLATVNEAIADLALQRYEPAQARLEAAVKADDKNVRAWYNSCKRDWATQTPRLRRSRAPPSSRRPTPTPATSSASSPARARNTTTRLRRSRRRWRSIRFSCPRSSASRAPTSAAGNRTTRRRTWIASRA
jgi:tetratricopeptide (TPR) repeat protein